ncbi:MAG TPA: symmetrical bis(5'-nucleosyl)-tetraphosphatase [Myxococcota bacterium]|nr:symmetrical bis(5'-nucleosyl)-tetraphosphatase [Myxococcota bacterium]
MIFGVLFAMAVYAIGDVQGCFLTLQRLLNEINFDERHDELIFLGDVVNRGPNSLEVLRLIKSHSSMRMLLGNHEIFTIALALNAIKPHRSHTLQPLLDAPDRESLIDFLRNQPLIIERGRDLFVHAGILPSHTIEQAIKYAMAISDILQSDKAKKFLERFYEKIPHSAEKGLGPKETLRLALAYLTLIRMCESPTTMDLSYSGTLTDAPKKLKPWFELRHDHNITVCFGHWAALGLYQKNNYICLDSGCVWGQELSAMRLSDKKIFQVANCKQLAT